MIPAAESVLRDAGIGPYQIPIDIYAVAEHLGMRVILFREPRNWTAALDLRANQPTIWIDGTLWEEHQRFALAHEVAHFLLHDVGPLHRDVTYARHPEDEEANLYALDLLAPSQRVHPLLCRTMRVEDLAVLFNVSPTAMTRRLQTMGY